MVNEVNNNLTSNIKKLRCNIKEKNKPNLELMAKAFTNLYNQSRKHIKLESVGKNY